MKKHTCPVCDQVMKYPYYCSHCHRIILHPNIQEITYYLNERHPAREEDCLYHGSTTQPSQTFAATGQAGGAGRKQEYQGSMAAEADAGSPALRQKAAGSVSSRKTHAGTSKNMAKTIVIVFAAVYVLASVFSIIWTIAKKADRTGNVSTEASAEAWEETAVAGENDTSRERPAKEVEEAGAACSQFGHLPATDHVVVSDFLSAAQGEGCTLNDSGRTDYNYESDGMTSYQRNYWFDFSREGETAQVQISFDTATKEFHGMVVTGLDEELMLSLAECIVTVLKDADVVDQEADFRESFYGAWDQDWGDRGGYMQIDTLDLMYLTPSPEDGEGADKELYLFAGGYFTREQ